MRYNIWYNCKLEYLKIVTNGHQHKKPTKDEEVYIINKCISFNQTKNDWKTIQQKDWNTPIYLKDYGPTVTVLNKV